MTLISDCTCSQPLSAFIATKADPAGNNLSTDLVALPRKGRQQAIARLVALGPQALSDAELLSLVLRSSERATQRDIGTELLSTYGSLRSVLIADRNKARTHGLTFSHYASLQVSLEIARRHYEEQIKASTVLENPKAVREFLRIRMRDLPYEVFAVIFLDSRHRFMQFKELFRGTIDGASVHPREVVREAITHNAAAVIAVHNHPSGIAEPSQADELITFRLKEALSLVDIRLLDHLIVGGATVLSLAERGIL